MNMGTSVRLAKWVVSIGMTLGMPSAAMAQSAVGSGPLTAPLVDTEPTVGVLGMGPVKFAPGIMIPEIGWDSNVFDEPESLGPKEDWVVSINPDVSAYSRLRLLRVSAYAGAELTYYNKYESERSAGHQFRLRSDLLLSRVRPFVGWGSVETRTRPNGEIDTRADRQEDELSGGVAFDLSPSSVVYGSSYLLSTVYESALEDGIDLSQTLTRDTWNYEGGLKTDLTPLLSMQLSASYREDIFKYEPIRNTQSWNGTATFGFAPDAVVNGTVQAGYRDMKVNEPGVKPYRGLVGNATISYVLLEVGRISAALSRDVEYSFDSLDAYYLGQSLTLAYTHRLFGEVDVQVKGSRGKFNYDAREDQPSRSDTLSTVGGSLGYNLRNRTRIALNYEYAERRSPTIAERNYQRRRAFLSWGYAF